ncbi:MAG: molybdopterin molybdotransferase MoeA [Alteromonadaceae bacterium]|nr:molybdopterin molybdotransferase MoeA [Alteromonadaceae bacterium]
MTDCFSAPGLLPFEQALSNMLASIKPIGLDDCETVMLENVLGRVLAQDISSPLNVPPHDNSAMDGYAFAFESLISDDCLTLVGRSMAGQPFQGVCRPGQCIRIMTGGKMPVGCDTVEMQENCEVLMFKSDVFQSNVLQSDVQQNEEQQNKALQTVRFSGKKSLGSHVRNAGEDIKEGQKVFNKSHRLTTVDIGVLASLGIASVKVFRKLNVALIATGDELKTPGQTLTEGDIFESNRYVLSAMLQKLNVNVIDFGVIEDDFQAIKTAFEQADLKADAVISSGGVSVGDADYTKDVLDELGKIDFWKIAMKPGKPFAFGHLKNSIFFGLPGNPVSALVTFHQLALPGLLKLQQCEALKRINLRVKTMTDLRKSPGRMDFQRGVLSTNEQGETVVTSTGAQGSGVLSSLARANCYIVLPTSQGKVPAGEIVTVQIFDQYLS